jgi:hypothetical protein
VNYTAPELATAEQAKAFLKCKTNSPKIKMRATTEENGEHFANQNNR